MSEQNPLTFDQALQRLEEVVTQLEAGEVPLEKAIELFAEGTQLADHCRKKLDWAQRQVEVLVQENGKWTKKSFPEEEE